MISEEDLPCPTTRSISLDLAGIGLTGCKPHRRPASCIHAESKVLAPDPGALSIPCPSLTNSCGNVAGGVLDTAGTLGLRAFPGSRRREAADSVVKDGVFGLRGGVEQE